MREKEGIFLCERDRDRDKEREHAGETEWESARASNGRGGRRGAENEVEGAGLSVESCGLRAKCLGFEV